MAIELMAGGGVVVTGDDIKNVMRPLALRSALKLEILGLARRGKSAYSIIKTEYGLKGNKPNVLTQFESILREKGVLKD